MKKTVLIFVFILFRVNFSFADTFSDAIQDLAMQTACIGKYSAAHAGSKIRKDPDDYYTPDMLAERFAKQSGNQTRTVTFYGVCFNYAQTAWEDIEKYKNWYNDRDMYEGQFWLAGNHDDCNTIILSNPTTKDNATAIQNGVYIKTYSTSNRRVKAHKDLSGKNATHHAWLWIERADGVWFWIDPTWTDNLGYIVYGYVSSNQEEIQCRPNKSLCVNYPAYLDNLPPPPEMGKPIPPSKTDTANRAETINYAGSDWISSVMRNTFINVNYDSMNRQIGVMLTASMPFFAVSSQTLGFDKIGFTLDMPILLNKSAFLLGVDYMQNLEDDKNMRAILLECDFTRRLFNSVAWYIGGSAGLRLDFSNTEKYFEPKTMSQYSYLGFKVNTGVLITILNFFAKAEISYNNIFGLSIGAGVGFGQTRF